MTIEVASKRKVKGHRFVVTRLKPSSVNESYNGDNDCFIVGQRAGIIRMLKGNTKFLSGAGIFALAVLSSAANAIAQDSVDLITHAKMAADAFNQRQWAKAKKEFRFCIEQKPNSLENYEGLYNTCMRTREWDQVAFALEKMIALDPSRKQSLAYDYGRAVFHVNRFDEAIPYLKTALEKTEADAMDSVY